MFIHVPIASKSLNSLTTIHILNWLGGADVTYPLWLREVPGSIPGSSKGFDFRFGGFCVFTFCQKTHDLLQNFAIPCAMLIYLVYLTYCKICDRLQGYKDTDLAYISAFWGVVHLYRTNFLVIHHMFHKYPWQNVTAVLFLGVVSSTWISYYIADGSAY